MKSKRLNLLIVALLLLAAWNPQIPGISGRILGPSGPVTRVVVICETADTTPATANITGGATARALREAGKWRLWDKDSVPEDSKALLDAAKTLPWCFVMHGTKATASVPLPSTEADFAALVQKQGGVQ